MSTYSNRLQPALQNLLQRVVQFFHPRSSCTPTHISADVQRITLNAPCMTISGGRTEQLDILCRVTGFVSDFLSFKVVELIRFFHRALHLFWQPTFLLPLLVGLVPLWPKGLSKNPWGLSEQKSAKLFWSLKSVNAHCSESFWFTGSLHCHCHFEIARALLCRVATSRWSIVSWTCRTFSV